jgi:hypothetical protein
MPRSTDGRESRPVNAQKQSPRRRPETPRASCVPRSAEQTSESWPEDDRRSFRDFEEQEKREILESVRECEEWEDRGILFREKPSRRNQQAIEHHRFGYKQYEGTVMLRVCHYRIYWDALEQAYLDGGGDCAKAVREGRLEARAENEI